MSHEPAAASLLLLSVATTPSGTSWEWWLAPLVLASVGSIGVLISRHYRKDEWDIIEEIGEAR